jgi:glycosyltransferase involved in cell wall biosynthesis
MISLAIPTYNRSDFTIQSFEYNYILNNPNISEIVILDDYSDKQEYISLHNTINNITSKKIKLFRNNSNLGPFRNKYEVVKRCNSDWIILLDSDNILNNIYIDIVSKLNKEEDVFYSPETLFSLTHKVEWDYSEYNHFLITKQNAKEYICKGNFETMLNTGNFFINRNKYIETFEQNCINTRLGVNDALYFSYLWLAGGNKIQVVPELNYIHRVHKGSWYKHHQNECGLATKEIHQKIKAL